MQEESKRYKYLTSLCVVLAFASVFLMLENLKLSKDLNELLLERSREPVSVTWINEETDTQISADADDQSVSENNISSHGKVYVVNKSSKKIHRSDCQYAINMKEENKQIIQTDNLDEYYLSGYTSCSKCKP